MTTMALPILNAGVDQAMKLCDHCKRLMPRKIPIELFDETKSPPVLLGEFCSRNCAVNAAADREAFRERSRLVAPPPMGGKRTLPVEW
jgi:hypothetical protein